MRHAAIRSIALEFPHLLRTNDYFRRGYPELVARSEEKSMARAFAPARSDMTQLESLWAEAQKPYLTDPFRGTEERRVLEKGTTSIDLETNAAKKALDAAEITPADVDQLIVASTFQEFHGPPNSTFIAKNIGYKGPAWSLQMMCSSALGCIDQATALILSKKCETVLVVASSTYSRLADMNDTLGWMLADGAAALVINSSSSGSIKGSSVRAMTESLNLFYLSDADPKNGATHGYLRASQDAPKHSPEIFGTYARECCSEALQRAGVSKDQIKLFACYTGIAWMSNFLARALDLEPSIVIDTYPKFGNISVASIPTNLYYAAERGAVCPGDHVLLYSHGFSGSAAAIVLEWGDVALGLDPPPSSTLPIDEPPLTD